MKKALKSLFVVFIIILFSCGKTERVDTEQVKDAIKQREIKKISDAEIQALGLKKGKKLSETLIDCFNKNKPDFWTNYHSCLDSLSLSLIDTIKFITPESASTLEGIEKDLFEAYNYNSTQNLELRPNLQDLKNQDMLYSYPTYFREGDQHLYKSPADDENSSYGIIFIYYIKKELILNL